MLVHATHRYKALAHPARLRILVMLEAGDLCVCQITAVLGLAPSTVSAHLADLKRGDLVRERKEGRWVHYALSGDSEVTALVESVSDQVKGDPRVRADAKVLKKLRSISVEELCRADFELESLLAGGRTTRHHPR